MELYVRKYTVSDLESMTTIWNSVVEAGNAFPQTDPLTPDEAESFFSSQSYCAVALNRDRVCGLYILHPNNIGRCGHICNASYAVDSHMRGLGAGEALVRDCLEKAAALGFGILQFNAVVKTNLAARRLYEKLGFTQLGEIPDGFHMKDGSYEAIIPYYHTLKG